MQQLNKRRALPTLAAAALLATGSGCGKPAPYLPPPEVCTGTTALDVLPGVYPNALELSGAGALEVGVLGDAVLEPLSLEPSTATLSDPDGSAEAVASEGPLEPRDVNGDGRVDAVLRFRLATLVEKGVAHAQMSRLKLNARTQSGTEVSGCDRAHAAGHALARLPAPTGPHAVGTTTWHWVDSGREEIFTEAKGDKRELMVRAWYPAEPQPRRQPAPYFLHRREGVGHLAHGFKTDSHPSLFDYVNVHAVAEAPLAAGGRFPVLLFSPGFGTSPASYAALLEELASHGYVVVATAHTHFSGPVLFPDGRYAPHTESPSTLDLTVFNVAVKDLRFVLSQVQALDAGDSRGQLTGRLDLERVGVLGHSFGGAAAAIVCRQEPSARACANMDGTFWGEYDKGLEQPFLLMRAKKNEDGTYGRFLRSLRGRGYDVRVSQAGHFDFTDVPLLKGLLESSGLRLSPEELGLGTLEPQRMTVITRDWVRAFLDEHVKGSGESPLLRGDSGDYPEVMLQGYPR